MPENTLRKDLQPHASIVASVLTPKETQHLHNFIAPRIKHIQGYSYQPKR
jgi:hypothetical protein